MESQTLGGGVASTPEHAASRARRHEHASTMLDVPVLRGRYVVSAKPIIDRVLAFLALVLLLPVMLVVALVVLLSLGRPIILRQERVGLGGRTFTVLKFRTMHPDRRVIDLDGYDYVGVDRRLTHKHPDDPRLTPAGRMLRKLSLDELPQLINVIRGEMSLVGPRPELPSVVAAH